MTLSYGVAELDSTVSAFGTNDFTTERALLKFGYTFEGANVWFGASWMDEEMKKVGRLDDGFGYDVLITRADWSPVFGARVIIQGHWDLTVEGGFGDRISATLHLGYNF